MANPQVENGHVDIANEIVEALARIRLSGEEVQCLWVILRKTYGWHKKEDMISLSQFSEMTGMTKNHVSRALKRLSSKMVIGITKNGDRTPNMFRLIKDFDIWLLSPKKGISPILDKPIPNIDKRVSPKMGNTKENNTKETITKEIIPCSFDSFWNSYPKKIGKKAAFRAWSKAKDKPPIEQILSALETQKKSDQWRKENGQYIPNPSTWINQGRWDDQPTPAKDWMQEVMDAHD